MDKIADIDYLDFVPGTLWNDYRGVSFYPTAAIPVPHDLYVTFTRYNGADVTLSWRNQNPWPAKEAKRFRSEKFIFRPSTIRIDIRFDNDPNGYVKSWTASPR